MKNGLRPFFITHCPQETIVPVPKRSEIKPGLTVQIVEKHNQRSGKLTEGVVADLLTSSATHPHGIKVRLTDGKVGRVQAIVEGGTQG